MFEKGLDDANTIAFHWGYLKVLKVKDIFISVGGRYSCSIDISGNVLYGAYCRRFRRESKVILKFKALVVILRGIFGGLTIGFGLFTAVTLCLLTTYDLSACFPMYCTCRK